MPLLHRKTACEIFPAHSKPKLHWEHNPYSIERAKPRLPSRDTSLVIMHYSALLDNF